MQNGKVLVVDDNRENRSLYQAVLQKEGYQVMAAEDGASAVTLTRRKRPDVVLLDIMMPEGEEGFSVLESIRASGNGVSHTPVIMVTGRTSSDELVKAFNLGADDYLRKPIDIQELAARVKLFARKHQLETDLALDLEVANGIQGRFLTDAEPVSTTFARVGYSVSVFNRSAGPISGDFYYPKSINNNAAGIFFADVCGHGVAAALISMRILSFIDHFRSPLKHASEFLAGVNEDLVGLMPTGRFVAASYLILTRKGYSISSSAQPPAVLITNGIPRFVGTYGPPLGQMHDLEFPEVAGALKKDDKLVLYTDGVVEAESPAGELFGGERLLEFLTENAALTPEALKARMVERLEAFTGGAEFDDDVSLMIFQKG